MSGQDSQTRASSLRRSRLDSGPVRSEADRLVEMVPCLLLSTDAENRIAYANHWWRELLGWDPHDLVGHLGADFLHPEDLERARAALRDGLAHDGTAELELRFRAKDESWHWIDWRIRFDGARWFAAGRPTRPSQLVEAERVAGIGSYEIEPDGGSAAWSDEHFRILGLEPGAIDVNRGAFLEFVHPEDRIRVQAYWEQLLTGAELNGSIEFRVQRADGAERILQSRDSRVNGSGTLRIVGTVQDVTERKRAQQALELSERRYRALVEQVPAVVYTAALGSDGDWEFVSPRIEQLLGYPAHEWTENSAQWYSAIHPDDRERVLEDEAPLTAPGQQLHSEYRMIAADGRVVHVLDEATVIENESGELRLQGFVVDVTERRMAEEALAEKHEQMQAVIDNSPTKIFAKDRNLNYLFVNREFAEVMGVEPGAITGRGDADFFPPELASEMRDSDRQVLESGQPLELERTLTSHGRERTYLVQKFPLRDAGGNVYGVCGIGTDISERKAREDELREKTEWSFRIRQAIAADRLVLHSQPIVEIAGGEKAQEELLLRMLGDDGESLVMPGEFLPPAERFGLAPAIDRWVVERAAQLARDQRVEVNLSGQSIGDPSLTEFIEAQLAASGADPSNLVFEITETTAAQDLDQARTLADRLTALGCGFALDDFGTGYGSFTYLKHLPVAYIKIDMEFVRDLDTDPSDRQVVKAIVDVARNFGIKTIAEGVESQQVLELLAELEVDYAQGYHLGRPAPLR